MAMTVSDIPRNADVFRRVYPCWPHPEPESPQEPAAASLAAWLEHEGIANPHEIAERLATAVAPEQLAAWLRDGTGAQELLAAAKGIADLDELGDAGWAAENYRHGHDHPREN